MSACGKSLRLSRILPRGRGALVIAFDHALVLGPLAGTADPKLQLRRFAESPADALLLNLGILRQAVDALTAGPAPAIIVRLDWTSIWAAKGPHSDSKDRSALVAQPEHALRHGADAVATYMIMGTGDADFEAAEIARTAAVARECETLGLPLIVESLARGRAVDRPADPEWLSLHTRVAAELGADAIKTEYSGDVESMRGVVRNCPVPILVLGGGRLGSDGEALELVRNAMRAGAAGVFFGRNVFQSPSMMEFLDLARAVLDGHPATIAP
jgi:class I fructose-bisphosphate aldolase